MLPEEHARAVEAQILPRAGEPTAPCLRAALRRAVIAVAPGRRAAPERIARPARRSACARTRRAPRSLSGCRLPGIGAAAAMTRISALARALKAAGAGGGIDLLRAQSSSGLLAAPYR